MPLEARERLPAPLRPHKVVAIGLNYRDHVTESSVGVPDRRLVFAMVPSSVIGPNEWIVLDEELSRRVDWEVELAAVIERRMRNVTETAALDHVFGYTFANDFSARDVPVGDVQWIRGKSFDTFCRLDLVVVTADELRDSPWGCDDFTAPPRSLAPGDDVEVDAEGIGVLRSPVVSAVAIAA